MKPWKETISPRADVREGRTNQSDFAVDLMKVVNGAAPEEYQDAHLFFERTYMTQGIAELLAATASRLAGGGGSPVIELKTNFGGGKSHTLLAIWHLARAGAEARALPGVAAVLDKAGVGELPAARVAAIDGNYRAPAEPRREGGRSIRTLWGDLAWRLLGAEGYDLVAESDAAGTAPGKEKLEALLAKAAPCAILLDELVAYYRQLDKSGLPGGSYDANLSFLQQLTEAAANTPGAVLFVTLPQSEGEAGGQWGQKVLREIGNVVHRVATTWHPVTRDESFEIVRRRLFEPPKDPDAVRETCEAYKRCYAENRAALPRDAQDPDYLDGFEKCYPIHPEVLHRLYDDWATLPNFQRTRGVLKLMALVVHRLWTDDGGDEALIMPGSIPFGAAEVASQATQSLSSGWGNIISAEIDGEGSAPALLDARNPQFGRLAAARRAARTVFLGSAPSAGSANRGIDAARVLLGCAKPGDELDFYRDALAKLGDTLRYLFRNGDRVWYDTRPNLNRTVQEKADRISGQAVFEAVRDAFLAKWGAPQQPGIYHAHVFEGGAKIPDDVTNGLRLAVLPPDAPYSPNAEKPAFDAARAILEYRGASARTYRNRIVFLAADFEKASRAAQTCRTALAWKETREEIEAHRLDVTIGELEDARRHEREWKGYLEQSVVETWRHLLVPIVGKKGAAGPCDFERFDVKTAAANRIGETASAALVSNEAVVSRWAQRLLRDHLERTYFGRGDDVSVAKVWDDMARYLDYRRLAGVDVLRTAIEEGVRDGLFGYASGKKPDGSYEGLRFREAVQAGVGDRDLLIKSSVAENATPPPPPPPPPTSPKGGNSDTNPQNPTLPTLPPPPPPPPPSEKKHFSGAVSLDISDNPDKLEEIREELLAHLSGKGLHATVRLEIRADGDEAFAPSLLRILKSNSRLLDESRLS